MDKTKQPGINIHQVFLDRASFSHRDDYLTIPASTPPKVGDINVAFRMIPSDAEPRALIQARARTDPEQKPMYEFDVIMSMVVSMDEAAPNMTLPEYAQTGGFASLSTFLRQTVADLTLRGRFGPVWLKPANLRIVFEEKKTPAATKKRKRSAKKKIAKASKKAVVRTVKARKKNAD
jgi:preprotein translocase subunit SecB